MSKGKTDIQRRFVEAWSYKSSMTLLRVSSAISSLVHECESDGSEPCAAAVRAGLATRAKQCVTEARAVLTELDTHIDAIVQEVVVELEANLAKPGGPKAPEAQPVD